MNKKKKKKKEREKNMSSSFTEANKQNIIPFSAVKIEKVQLSVVVATKGPMPF